MNPYVRKPTPSRRTTRGVTLVELLVGMTIGLLSVVIITQVMAVSEEQKRTTSSGSDAQVNGALALSSLQREIRMAGYGLVGAPFAAGCEIRGATATGPLAGPAEDWILTPVRIEQGAAGAPDRIRVMRSNSKSYAVPYITASVHLKDSKQFVMRNVVAYDVKQGDTMLAISSALKDLKAGDEVPWCTLFTANELRANPDDDPVLSAEQKRILPHLEGASAPWNLPEDRSVFFSSYPAGSVVVNLGTLVNDIYSIANNDLIRTPFNSATNTWDTAQPQFSQIVDLQAIYGLGAAGVVNTWTETSPVTREEWQSVMAVRVAVVARSAQREKEVVTPARPKWIPDPTKTTEVELALGSVDAKDVEWQHYRYKVYETVVPLRNVLWQSKLN